MKNILYLLFFISSVAHGQVDMKVPGIRWKSVWIDTAFHLFGTTAQYVRGDGSMATFPTSNSSFSNGAGYEVAANKDATGGYAGLTLYKINFKNAANTFTSFFTNSNDASRTYIFPNKDMTVADNADVVTNTSAVATHTTTLNRLNAISTIVGNTTLDATYRTVLADAAGGTFTITLPAAASSSGQIYEIKKITAGNSVIIDANASEVIDGALTATITQQYNSITIKCNGTAWYIL